MRRDHLPRSGIGEKSGRRIFAILAISRRSARRRAISTKSCATRSTFLPAVWIGIDLRVELAPNLPPVEVDPEQFKRVIVNLVDNAAEAMRDSLVKRLFVATQLTAPIRSSFWSPTPAAESRPSDKEKLFLPYFSTKGRGTGLGLAIVNHILSEHGARIRVEDNRPAGARFYVEVPRTVGCREPRSRA